MSIQWVVNGCAVNALTFKIEHIKDIIPDSHYRLQKHETVKEGDQAANISGKLTWVKVAQDEVGQPSRLVGRIIIREKQSKLL